MILALVALLSAGPVVSVSPQVIMNGGTVRVTCRIPRLPENRRISFGVPGSMSTIDLEGDNSRSTYQKTIQRVGCFDTPATCILTDNMGKSQISKMDLHIGGCDDAQ